MLHKKLKAANAQIRAFKSGEKYIRMQEEYLKELRSLERKIRKLESELSYAHSETISVRNQWFEIFEELQKECERTRKAAFASLLLSPVLHTDCTNAKENGKNVSVFVCATLDGKAMYFARRKKGTKG